MLEGYEYIDDRWYRTYLEDVEIAKKEIQDMKLYPKKRDTWRIICLAVSQFPDILCHSI